MKPIPILCAIILITATQCLAIDNFLVTRVIDGDTIVAGGQKIRYIGINAPEINKTDKISRVMGEKAKAYNEALVLGKDIQLEFDVRQKDQWGRLLAYVFVDDVLVNGEMVSAGYASASPYSPNTKYANLFKKLEQEARYKKKGLWQCK